MALTISALLALVSLALPGRLWGGAHPLSDPDALGNPWSGPSLGTPLGIPLQCDGSGVDPWITDFRDRVMAYDQLARFAEERFGVSTACEGTVTMEFDGAKFGTLLLSFPGGHSLEVVTMPIESSVTTLRADPAFSDETEIRELLHYYARELGLSIDWTTPEEEVEGAEVVQRFWDPDPGLNASASLIFSKGRLVAIRLSMAL